MKYLYCVAKNGNIPVRKIEIEKETQKTYVLTMTKEREEK